MLADPGGHAGGRGLPHPARRRARTWTGSPRPSAPVGASPGTPRTRGVRGDRALLPPGLRSQPGSDWIPALEGVEAKLERGRQGRRRGLRPRRVDPLAGARRFPARGSSGFDYHARSVEQAAQARRGRRACRAGRRSRLRRRRLPGRAASTWWPTSTPSTTWPTPSRRPATSTSASADDGTFLLVEPSADDRLEDNLNPVGRLFSGGVAGDLRRRTRWARGPGRRSATRPVRRGSPGSGRGRFSRVRRATETPFNLVLEARP